MHYHAPFRKVRGFPRGTPVERAASKCGILKLMKMRSATYRHGGGHMTWFQATYIDFDPKKLQLDQVQSCLDWLGKNVGPEHSSYDFMGKGYAFKLDELNEKLFALPNSARTGHVDAKASMHFEVFIHYPAQADAFRAAWSNPAA